jgi:hypothetical protein
MRPLRAWLLRLRGVFRSNRDGQFAEEIEAHLEMHVRDLIESGLTPDEARREAIMKLGGVESTRQGLSRHGTASLGGEPAAGLPLHVPNTRKESRLHHCGIGGSDAGNRGKHRSLQCG